MPISQIWEKLKLKLNGHYRYYGVSENSVSVKRFRQETIRLVYKWLNRRSQRRSFNWKEFFSYLDRFPLPVARLYHDLYALGDRL